MTLYANTSTHGASAGGKPHASESFETTPFRPRTQEPLALIRAVKNQQETLLEASQKHRGERVPTGDRLDATKTFPNSHAPPLMSRSCSYQQSLPTFPISASPTLPAPIIISLNASVHT